MDLNGPALKPPPGVTSNLDNPPENNQLAWVGFFWGTAYPAIAMIKAPGYYRHQWDTRFRDLIPMAYWTFIFGVCYSFLMPCIKSAILIQWCRIFVPRGNRLANYFWWGAFFVISIQVAAAFSKIILLNLRCTPHSAIWDISIADRKCFSLYKIQASSATIQLVCDITILLLPQRIIWGLQMTWQRRLGVLTIFGMGLIACGSAAARMTTTIIHGNAEDQVYTLAPLVLWLMAEMTCGFFVACVVSIPKIIRESICLPRFKIGLFSILTKSRSVEAANRSANVTQASGMTSACPEPDEDSIPINMRGAEPTGPLQQAPSRPTIVRTTRIGVTQEFSSTADTETSGVHNTAWGM
ncbi:hypothetical protein F5Y11DRAFT_345047 [Daldinia sp. FL1419]|nr:hypothetical protein F5Y11DRAFT_345047 [Daldinia sp. FL1419]